LGSLPPDGQALVGFARGVLEASERLCAFFSASGPRELIPLGVSEDLTLCLRMSDGAG